MHLMIPAGGEAMTHEEFQCGKNNSDDYIYRKIFDEYCGYVHTIVFNILRSSAEREDIEECVGDVFADVYRYFDSDSEREGDIKGFIATIARRKALRYLKKLSSGKNIFSTDDNEFEQIRSSDDVENEVSDTEIQKLLIEKINELGEPDCSILIHKYYYNRTSTEISEIMNISPQSVRVRSSRALKKLRKALEKSGISFQEQ
ncbi:MAG: sigma-70 family RNA polymerase sigma factor [Oscillospiraceae bacterium]|nr:sigma-70 family RNA polymerase sigma factor [Oscillospiraceae bacterium]